MKLYGIRNISNTGRHSVTLATSMAALIKPYSYSLNYAGQKKQNPKSSRGLCSALSGTGSYWSLRTQYRPLTAAECKICYSNLSPKEMTELNNNGYVFDAECQSLFN